MTQGRTKTDERILGHYRAVARALDRVTLPKLIESGITMPQFKALLAVLSAGSEGISVTELGTELSIGQPSASLIVSQIVRLGYATRTHDTTDRRRVLVTVTPAGIDLAAELRHGRHSTLLEWLANLSDEDAEFLERGFRALEHAIQSTPAEK